MPRINGSTVNDWISWLAGSDVEKRRAAKNAMGSIGSSDEIPIEPLISALSNYGESETVCLWVAVAFARIGSKALVAAPTLVEVATSHFHIATRQAALMALASIAPNDELAKSAVMAAMSDLSPLVRIQAVSSIISFHRILNATDVEKLKSLLLSDDKDIARGAEIAIRNIQLRDEAM